jgi:hypothetical protein
MKSVKNHAKQRYCERILGITDPMEWKRYLVQNDEQVVEHVNRMVEHSNFIYRGQIGDNTTKVFRMADNVVLILNSTEEAVITMFKCNFDFGEDMDRQIIRNELNVLDNLNAELISIDESIKDFTFEAQAHISTIDLQMKAMEEQIKSLRVQKEAIEGDIKAKRSTRDFSAKEIEKRAVRMCNSIEYRKDLNANA